MLLLTTFVCFGETTKVTRVIDGDTFEIESGEKVRLIGINAPEISDLYGQEAKQYLTELIENKTVDMQIDNISNDRGHFHRLLRYIILDGVDLNKQMVSDGYAFAYLKYHFIKSREYEYAQSQARETNKGIWGDNNKGTIIKVQENKERAFWQVFSPKVNFISILVLILVFIGLNSYFKE